MVDLDNFEGDGVVLNGDTLVARAHYVVRERRRLVDVSHAGGSGVIPPGLRKLECDLSKVSAPLPPGITLTLVMSDGRRINVCDIGGSIIQPMGGIY
jgi:hypothetical protein